MDIREYNRSAWDRQVDENNHWTVPVTPEQVASARKGEWQIQLTSSIPAPREWFGEVAGRDVLCLASGGGQQGPILAAAGARVTVFDNSPKQLEQDLLVAKRENLQIRTVEGDMRNLTAFEDESFDLIVHPVSNVFVPEVKPVWIEAFRVLRYAGELLAGFSNPANYLFDYDLIEREGKLRVRYKLPYSDETDLPEDQKKQFVERGLPFEYSHSLEAQIGGQLKAGFVITAFFEDHDRREDNNPLSDYMPTYMATRALKTKI